MQRRRTGAHTRYRLRTGETITSCTKHHLPPRNGKEKVDLDLIVLDKDHHDCAMYAKGNKQCSCTHSYTG